MEKLFKLEDKKNERVVFTGTEKECMDYTKEHPERTFIMTEVKK